MLKNIAALFGIAGVIWSLVLLNTIGLIHALILVGSLMLILHATSEEPF